MLKGRKIILGITGGIAAYKSAFLARLLVRAGAEVRVVMTPSAKDFVTPLTLSTLSKNPVESEFVKNRKGEWTNHVEMGLWADLMLIAPASANTVAKMASGECDNLLLAVYLSARCPVIIAPAMDLDMYRHPSTEKNFSTLKKEGVHIIPAGTGELASGLSGEGRMEEPEAILRELKKFFAKNMPLSGKKALVTAGPTYEAIDPVRFIGNHSSGKMGFAIAGELARLGAEVLLISGPSSLEVKLSGINRIDVISADEMFKACMRNAPRCDIIIKAAAVADYKPVAVSKEKIKKTKEGMTLQLERTRDILAALGQNKKKKQVLVGFSLETTEGLKEAKEKLLRKKLDAIVLNSLLDKGAGFGTDTNKITIITRDNKSTKFELKSKESAAKDIVQFIINRFLK